MPIRRRKRTRKPRRRSNAKAAAKALEAVVVSAFVDLTAHAQTTPGAYPADPADVRAMAGYLDEYGTLAKRVDELITELGSALNKGVHLESLIHSTAQHRLGVRRIPDAQFTRVTVNSLADLARAFVAGGVPLPAIHTQAAADKLRLQIEGAMPRTSGASI